MSARARVVILMALGCVVLLGPAGGCGGGSGNRVSGKVTFKGQPVPAGKIYFTPDTSKGNKGATGYADIRDGAYDTSATDGQGAPAGAVIISVDGFDPTPPPGAEPDVTMTKLFAGYQKPVELPAGGSVQDIDVPPEAANGPAQPAEKQVIVP